MTEANIFEQIIDGKIPSDKVYEDKELLAFKDIAPQAPVHILIIPKKRGLQNLQALKEKDLDLMPKIVKLAQELAEKFEIQDNYRLLTNNGEAAGQSVFHLHFHLIGGKKLENLV